MSAESAPKLKEMLDELHQLVHNIQDERNRGEGTLQRMQTVHEKVQQEAKVSPYQKTKLKNIYTSALAEAQAEAKLLQEALEKITEIKTFKTKAVANAGPQAPAMRRGVLMSMIHKDAANLPLWQPDSRNEKPPALCGCLAAESSYIVPKGKYVAAKTGENWILAEVVSYNNNTTKYDVDDIDSDEGSQRHIITRKRIIVLPLYKADPVLQKECLFKKQTTIMALYPQTTCFYKGVIHELPKTAEDGYSILFEDVSYPDGYSPPLPVAQRYVIPYID